MTDLERYVLRVLRVWQQADIGGEQLMWKATETNVGFAAMCSDVFYWGTADAEAIMPEDVDLLDQCLADLASIGAEEYLPELFCARKRGMRPQAPWGRGTLNTKVRALFDAAGPVRDPKDEW